MKISRLPNILILIVLSAFILQGCQPFEKVTPDQSFKAYIKACANKDNGAGGLLSGNAKKDARFTSNGSCGFVPPQISLAIIAPVVGVPKQGDSFGKTIFSVSWKLSDNGSEFNYIRYDTTMIAVENNWLIDQVSPFQTITEISGEDTIPVQRKIIENPDEFMPDNVKYIVIKGQDGQAKIKTKTQKADGLVVSNEELSRTILQAPVDETHGRGIRSIAAVKGDLNNIASRYLKAYQSADYMTVQSLLSSQTPYKLGMLYRYVGKNFNIVEFTIPVDKIDVLINNNQAPQNGLYDSRPKLEANVPFTYKVSLDGGDPSLHEGKFHFTLENDSWKADYWGVISTSDAPFDKKVDNYTLTVSDILFGTDFSFLKMSFDGNPTPPQGVMTRLFDKDTPLSDNTVLFGNSALLPSLPKDLSSLTLRAVGKWADKSEAFEWIDLPLISVTTQDAVDASTGWDLLKKNEAKQTAGTSICEGAPISQLKVDAPAWVSTFPPLPNRVRKDAGEEFTIIGKINPGVEVLVTEGPKCNGGAAWWKIKSKTGLVGWTMEGDSANYWVEPCKNGPCPIEKP